MSYEIVKGIKIENEKVLIKSSSNNVYPKTYNWEEFPSLSKIYKEQGKDAVEIEILKIYEGGSFQAGTKNKFTRALEVLKDLYPEEYKIYNWRNHNSKYGSEEHKQEQLLRKSEEFKQLLLKALKTKMPKEKYIICCLYNDRKIYGKMKYNKMYWYEDKTKATKFNFKKQAENTLSCFRFHNKTPEVEEYEK